MEKTQLLDPQPAARPLTFLRKAGATLAKLIAQSQLASRSLTSSQRHAGRTSCRFVAPIIYCWHSGHGGEQLRGG
jgi:lambda repressor-like predicted transcriptional regulator